MIKKLKKIFLFDEHTCPWWLAYSWDNRLRRLFHNPDKIIKPYLKPGDKALDVGCGMGYFSIAMAKYVGDRGKVYALDIQPKMLEVMRKRSRNAPGRESISPVLAKDENFRLPEQVDFILSFWVLHEVTKKETLVRNLHSSLKTGGKFLLIEPPVHTSQRLFYEEVKLCREVGYRVAALPEIKFSRSVLFEKPE